MADGVKALLFMAFSGALGVMFLLLSCALPAYANWTPLSLLVFYMAVPVPYLLARRHAPGGVLRSDGLGGCAHTAAFITGALVLSTLALPVVLARAPRPDATIAPGACVLSTLASTVVLLTTLAFFRVYDDSSSLSF